MVVLECGGNREFFHFLKVFETMTLYGACSSRQALLSLLDNGFEVTRPVAGQEVGKRSDQNGMQVQPRLSACRAQCRGGRCLGQGLAGPGEKQRCDGRGEERKKRRGG